MARYRPLSPVYNLNAWCCSVHVCCNIVRRRGCLMGRRGEKRQRQVESQGGSGTAERRSRRPGRGPLGLGGAPTGTGPRSSGIAPVRFQGVWSAVVLLPTSVHLPHGHSSEQPGAVPTRAMSLARTAAERGLAVPAGVRSGRRQATAVLQTPNSGWRRPTPSC